MKCCGFFCFGPILVPEKWKLAATGVGRWLMTLIDPVVGAAGSSFIFQRIIVLQKRDKMQKKKNCWFKSSSCAHTITSWVTLAKVAIKWKERYIAPMPFEVLILSANILAIAKILWLLSQFPVIEICESIPLKSSFRWGLGKEWECPGKWCKGNVKTQTWT